MSKKVLKKQDPAFVQGLEAILAGGKKKPKPIKIKKSTLRVLKKQDPRFVQGLEQLFGGGKPMKQGIFQVTQKPKNVSPKKNVPVQNNIQYKTIGCPGLEKKLDKLDMKVEILAKKMGHSLSGAKVDTCKQGYILNPATGRCVKKTGAIGKKLLKQKKLEEESIVAKSKCKYNQKTNRCNLKKNNKKIIKKQQENKSKK